MQILNDSNDKIYHNNFIYSYRTDVTRKTSLLVLKYYMNFLGAKTLRELVENKPQKIIESDIRAYLVYLRNEKKILHSSRVLYLAVIKKFYTVNIEYPIRWKLINMYLGNEDIDDDGVVGVDSNSGIDSADSAQSEEEEDEMDRPYSREEIQKMFNGAQDIRAKLVISLLSSTGLRHGAVNILKLKDLEKIEKYNIYKITAYRKSKKFKYYTFCTPECSAIIDNYLEYRKSKGEELKGNSPLIREQFNTNDKLKVNNPRHLTSKTIRNMINDVLTKYTNLRKKIPFDHENNRKEHRNPTMLTHGFRKFFTVECTKAGVYHEIVERLVGHTIPGSRNSYLLFNPQTLLEGTAECKGYVTAINELTINDEFRLKKENQELKDKDEYSKFVIDKKMKEKDDEIAILKNGFDSLKDSFKKTVESLGIVTEIVLKMDQQKQKERKLDREFELETDPHIKDQKFDKMLSATRQTIKKRSELERTVKQQLENK